MKRHILSFAHDDVRGFAGGLAKYIREETELAAKREIGMVTVFPLYIRQCPKLAGWASQGWGVCRNGRWEGMFRWRGLVALLGKWEREGWGLAEIQLHHIGGYCKKDLRAFLSVVRVPVRLFLHDYSTVCRSTHLLRDGREHCGTTKPCAVKCRNCRYWDPAWLPNMKTTLEVLGDRLTVTAPSESVARGWADSYPELKECVEVVPHWCPVRMSRGAGWKPGGRLRLAFAGAQLPHKGWDAWCRVVDALEQAGSPFECLYFGLGRNVPRGVRAVEVGEGEMTRALRREGVDLLFLWPVMPETFSYVYFEAVQAGAWVLAPEVSGNVAEAIRNGGWGTVFRDEAELLAFLLDGARVRATLEHAQTVERPAEMAVNPRVLDTLPEPHSLALSGGWGHRAWLHTAVWKLKEWTGHV